MAVKSLNTLIRVARRALDELKRKQANLERQREALVMLSGNLAKELENEITLAAENVQMGGFFGNFAERIQKRQEQIKLEVKSLDKQLQQLAAEVMERFSELKKFEIARDNRLRAAEEAERKKEEQAMDEIGIRQYRRKKNT